MPASFSNDMVSSGAELIMTGSALEEPGYIRSSRKKYQDKVNSPYQPAKTQLMSPITILKEASLDTPKRKGLAGKKKLIKGVGTDSPLSSAKCVETSLGSSREASVLLFS